MTNWNTPEGRRVAEVVAQAYPAEGYTVWCIRRDPMYGKPWQLALVSGPRNKFQDIDDRTAARILDGDAREWLEERWPLVTIERSTDMDGNPSYEVATDPDGFNVLGREPTYSATLIAAVLAVLKETEDGARLP